MLDWQITYSHFLSDGPIYLLIINRDIILNLESKMTFKFKFSVRLGYIFNTI